MLKRTLFAILAMAGFVTVSAQSIKVTSERWVSLGTGNLTVEYSGAPVGTSAWIGVYKSGKTPSSSSPSYKWAYTDGESGTATFDLQDWDAYTAYLFGDGGYTPIAQAETVLACDDYSLGSSFEMTTDKTIYEEGDPVVITWKNAPAFSKDWIGIYKSSETPGVNSSYSTSYGYVTAADGSMTLNVAGAKNFDGDDDFDAPGEYYVTYLLWDGYSEVFKRVSYKVVGKGESHNLTIASDDDWNTFVADPDQYATGTITLTADVTASAAFTGTFTGTFDGQGHTITLPSSLSANFGLFQTTGEGATIKNLNVKGDVTSTKGVSSLIYTVSGATTIENVHSTANISSTSYPVAGFVASCTAATTFTNCSYKGNLLSSANASDDVSCFISTTSSKGAFKFKNCSAAGTITVQAGWRCSNYVSSDNATVGESTFENCIMACDMMQENGSARLGGFIGSPNTTHKYIFTNCLALGKVQRYNSNSDHTVISQPNGLALGCNGTYSFTVTNSYFASSTSYTSSCFTLLADNELASGAACYKLNGDQSAINYYQTLNEDQLPVLDTTHKQVYANGKKHCNGNDYDDVTYNNESGSITQDDHNYVANVCDYCGEMKLDEEGCFHMASDAGWTAFAKVLEGGKYDLPVKLEADIKVTQMLTSGYKGTFDGQGHTITMTIGASTGKNSLFGTIGAATIKNLVLEGTVTGESNSAPICSTAGGELTIENVISKVTVNQTTTNDGNCGGFIGLANANVTFRNCIFAGTVNAMKDAGGFAGWAVSRTFTMENCAMIGDVTVSQGSSSVFLRVQANSNTYNVSNCYYVPCTPTILCGNGSEMCGLPEKVTAEDVASGALCYRLNGDQSNIAFYQKAGEGIPSIDASLGRIYASGKKHCDGTDYDDINYNNVGGDVVQDEHDYENNCCTYCGALQLDESGVFHIVDETGYKAYAKALTTQPAISAVLENDLTLVDECPMLGSAASKYAGTFDGQGHTINVNINTDATAGVFSYTAAGAAIRNLVVDGSITGGQTGFIGDCGGALDMENIIMNASVTGTVNVGGLIGNGSLSTAFDAYFKNILVSSKLTYTGTAGKNGAGGFAGWSSYGTFHATNCAFIGDITGDCETKAYMFRTRSTSYYDIKNCAYIPVEGITYCNGHKSERAAGTAVETAADGQLCYFLNGNSWKNPVFFQTIGSDEAPVFDETRGVVYPSKDGYSSSDVTTEDGLNEMIQNLIALSEDKSNVEEHPAQKSISEAYQAAFESLQELTSFDELVAAYYPAIDALDAKLDSSIVAYEAYVQKIEETQKYLDEHADDFKKGSLYSKLESYLEGEVIEPSEDEYPNGSSAYILDSENLLLDVAQLETEKAFIDKMLEDALNEGLNPGADATTLLANADFSDGFNSWEGTKMTTAAVNEDGNMRVAVSKSSSPFDMHQTITVPENGVYELQINGAYRIAELGDCQQHGAMVYLNGNQNYLQADIEDMIPVDEAVHRMNCWIEGSTTDFLVEDQGYTINGQQGAAYAFLAGRYPNRILCNVTDGKLTVGIKNSHVLTTGYEWAAVGNIKLTYCGTLDEAGEALDATLQSMKDRADFILNTYQYASDLNYKYYPNYDAKLKDALQEKVDAIATTTEAEGKYALIQEIGTIFEQILNCKKNYSHMFTMEEALAQMIDSMEDQDKAQAVGTACLTTGQGYEEGKYTSEEAAAGGDLKDCGMLPTFNEDGAAVISSADELDMYAALVNGGLTSLNAVVTADIEANASFPMIAGVVGDNTLTYTGTFDGQGHTITIAIEGGENASVGFFRQIGAATIKNVQFNGTINGGQNTGMIGTIAGNAVISGVTSNLTIVGGNNTGGFAGTATTGTQYFSDCVFSGKVTTTVNGVGGFYGWAANNKVVASNLLSIGEVVGEQAAYIFRVKCDGTIGTAGDAGCRVTGSNMYFLRTSDDGVLVSGTPLWWGEFLTDVILEVDEKQLASGEVCYKLNQGNTENPFWRQTLGTDKVPLLNSDSKIVYEKDGTYYNAADDRKRGDITGDGVVDGSDVVALVNIIISGSVDDDTFAIANLNGDSTVDGSDLVTLVSIITEGGGTKQLREFMKRYRYLMGE